MKKQIFFLLLISALFTGCNGKGNSDSLEEPTIEVRGAWKLDSATMPDEFTHSFEDAVFNFQTGEYKLKVELQIPNSNFILAKNKYCWEVSSLQEQKLYEFDGYDQLAKYKGVFKPSLDYIKEKSTLTGCSDLTENEYSSIINLVRNYFLKDDNAYTKQIDFATLKYGAADIVSVDDSVEGFSNVHITVTEGKLYSNMSYLIQPQLNESYDPIGAANYNSLQFNVDGSAVDYIDSSTSGDITVKIGSNDWSLNRDYLVFSKKPITDFEYTVNLPNVGDSLKVVDIYSPQKSVFVSYTSYKIGGTTYTFDGVDDVQRTLTSTDVSNGITVTFCLRPKSGFGFMLEKEGGKPVTKTKIVINGIELERKVTFVNNTPYVLLTGTYNSLVS